MSKKFIKLISLFVSCLLVFATLTGCGTNNEKQTSEGEKSQTEKNEGSENQEPATIQLVVDVSPDENSEIIKRIEKKYNVKFDFSWVIPQDRFDEVLGVKLASGDMPDFIPLPDSARLNKYIQQGVAAPITDEMKAKIPTYFKVVEKYNEGGNLWVDAMYDGKLYGLKRISAQGAYPTVLVWNKEWLKNVGVDSIPKTLDEFEEVMYKFAKEDPNKNGDNKDTYGLSETTFNAVFGAFEAVPLKNFNGQGRQTLFMTQKDGKITFAAIQPEMKQALALLQKWYKDKVIDPEFITGENKGGYWATSHAFINGRVGVTGMVLPTHWNPPFTARNKQGGAVYEAMIAAHPDAKFGETFDFGPGPIGPDGKSGTHKWGAVNWNVQIFTTNCVKDERKINALLNLIEDNFSDFDQYELLTKGIEGEHYTKSEDGEYIGNPEKYKKTADKKRSGVHILNLIPQPKFQEKMGLAYFNFIKKYDYPSYTDARYPTVDGFTKYNSTLQRLTLEAYMDIITGEKNVDYFDEFVEKFRKNGGDEIEKQINETIAKNMGK